MHRNHAELLGVPEMEEKQKNKRYVLRKLFLPRYILVRLLLAADM